MNNHHLSKRKKAAIRFFTYGAMTLAVVVISIVCILLILGYQFNAKSGTIEQGGLIQFRSFPSSASIRLDDKQLSFRTPGKLNVSAGQHTVTMSLSGYQEWRKTTTLKAGELKWLNYARMIPQNITSRSVASFEKMSDALPSPDRRWYALLPDSAAGSVIMYDIRDPQNPKSTTITIPVASFTAPAEGQTQSFSLEEWDFGARYVLVRHQVGETLEYIRVDRTSTSNGVNVTAEFNLPFRDIHFSGTSGNVFYALNGTDLRLIDLSGRTVSRPLVQHVDAFELYKSNIIGYVATQEENRVVGVYIDDKDTVVRTYPKDQAVAIDISSYYDNEYLAISTTKAVEILKDPQLNADSAGRVFAEFDTDFDIQWIRFANSGRFLVAGNGITFKTYDLETDEEFAATFEGVTSDSKKPLQWLDDYYLVSDATGSLAIGEFDGMNHHNIVSVAPGYSVTLSEDGEYLFSIGKSATGYTLQSSKMIVE